MAKHRNTPEPIAPIEPVNAMTIPEIIAHLRSIGAPLAASLETTYERVKKTKTPAEIEAIEAQLRTAFADLNVKLKEQGLSV